MVKADRATGTFTWFSDIHYDPFYGQSVPPSTISTSTATRLHPIESYPPSVFKPKVECENATSPFGVNKCDSSFNLVHSCISAAVDTLRNPDFVLVTGDFARHGSAVSVNEKAKFIPAINSLEHIFSEVANLLRIGYPGPIPILPALGNDDFIADYFLDIKENNNALLETAKNAFHDLLTTTSSNTDTNTNTMRTTFRQGGYYANEIFIPNKDGSKQPGLTIVVLNTVIYSQHHRPDQTDITDPYNQFKWLNKLLATARIKNFKIYITGHIPPTVGSFRHSQFWHDMYLDRYLQLIHSYKDVVVAQLFGHLHSNEFRVLSASASQSDGSLALPPLLIASSVTPIFGDSSPSFRLVTFDRSDFTILDYETRFIDINDATSIETPPRWKRLPSFRETYGVPDISLTSLQDVVRGIYAVDEMLDIFYSRMYVNSKHSIDTECNQMCRIQLKCTLQSSTTLGFNDCVTRLTPSTGSNIVFIVSVIFAAVFTFFTVRCFYKPSSDTNSVSGSGNLGDDDATTESEEFRTEIPQID